MSKTVLKSHKKPAIGRASITPRCKTLRDLKSLMETLAHPAFVWSVAVCFSLLVCAVLTLSGPQPLLFHLNDLNDISKSMVSFLGIVVAILVAALTTMYVRSSENEESGFRDFLQSLNLLRNLPFRMDEVSDIVAFHNQSVLYEFDNLTTQLCEFIEELNEIKPGWEGYDSNPELENNLNSYVECWTNSATGITLAMRYSGVSKSPLLELGTIQQGNLRVILVALLTMDKGTLGKALVGKLIRLSFSLTMLLVLSVAVLATTGLSEGSLMYTPVWFNLFLYVLLPSVAVFHVLGFVEALYVWRHDVRKREEKWK